MDETVDRPKNPWKCTECDWLGSADDMLRAPNPFDKTDEITGCPKCKSIDQFRMVCDVPGCMSEVSSGTPTPDGYRNTCFEHRPTVSSVRIT